MPCAPRSSADNAGTIIKSMGDGWLVEFASGVAAVNAAMQVQDRLRDHASITLRIGVHTGDLTRTEFDVYGDGINIAARLEGLAPGGGIMISDAVYAGLDGTLSPSFEAAGAQTIKNIARPVTTWVRLPHSQASPITAATAQSTSALPTLTIMPTANSDSRAEVQDTADALTADMGTYFGSINWLTTRISGTGPTQGYCLRPKLRARRAAAPRDAPARPSRRCHLDR